MSVKELVLDKEACAECGLCVAVCGYDALVLRSSELEVIQSECVLCDACVIVCPTEALSIG